MTDGTETEEPEKKDPIAKDPRRARLGAQVFDLELPSSFAVRHEIVGMGGTNAQRAFGAALGMCCPRLLKLLKLSYERSGFSPAKFGGEAIDALIEQKVPMSDILDAGSKAYGLLAASLLTEKEVAAEEVFTHPTPEASTSRP